MRPSLHNLFHVSSRDNKYAVNILCALPACLAIWLTKWLSDAGHWLKQWWCKLLPILPFKSILCETSSYFPSLGVYMLRWLSHRFDGVCIPVSQNGGDPSLACIRPCMNNKHFFLCAKHWDLSVLRQLTLLIFTNDSSLSLTFLYPQCCTCNSPIQQLHGVEQNCL